MSGTSRFDCYPSDFLNGVIGLTTDEIAAYTIVMMRQYDLGEPVPYVGRERELMVRTGLSKARLAKAIDRLVFLEKLNIVDGALNNNRTRDEIEKIREKIEKYRQNSREGGEATRRKFGGLRNENSDCDGPTGQPTGQPKTGPIPSSPVPRPLEDKNNLAVVRPKRVRTRGEYSEDFEAFWTAYPTDANMSKKEAYDVWKRLAPEDRALAIKAVPAFVGYCRQHPDYRPKHANRWLSGRRFDGHAAAGQRIASKVFIAQDTPAWKAWQDYLWATTSKGSPTMDRGGKRGWNFDSEWPPGHVHDQAREDAA